MRNKKVVGKNVIGRKELDTVKSAKEESSDEGSNESIRSRM